MFIKKHLYIKLLHAYSLPRHVSLDLDVKID